MENNLDDFFNEKLNDFSSSNDGWDEPSESVWENAQSNVPTYGNPKRNWLVILAILLGLSLLGTGTYLFKTQKENRALQQEVIALNSQFNKKQSSKSVLENQNVMLQSELEKTQTTFKNERAKSLEIVKELENACTVSSNNAVKNNTAKYQKAIAGQQQQINQLEQENQSLKTKNLQLKQQNIVLINSNNKIENQRIITNNPLRNKSFLVETTSPESIDLGSVKQPEKTWKKYEFGIDVSSIGFNMELSNSLQNTRDFSSNQTSPTTIADAEAFSTSSSSYYIANATSTGFHFGYAPKENFYIRTGLRYANFNIDNTHISGIIYDGSTEYLNNQGQTVNDLTLNNSTPFNNVSQDVTVEIPTGSSLQTGDVLFSTLTNVQDYHFFQVPLGVAYYAGKRRWQWEFQGGLTYNHIRFGDYSLNAMFQADNINIPISSYEAINSATNSTTYLGAYLGIGANYKISESWQIRAGLTFEETGLRTNARNFPRRYLLDSGLNLSLNYRF